MLKTVHPDAWVKLKQHPGFQMPAKVARKQDCSEDLLELLADIEMWDMHLAAQHKLEGETLLDHQRQAQNYLEPADFAQVVAIPMT